MEATQIPADAFMVRSDVWIAPAGNSGGQILFNLRGTNIKVYKVFGMSKNLAMGPNLPEGSWAGCQIPNQDCDNGYSKYVWPPQLLPTAPSEITLQWKFENWSGDYTRACCWAALITRDHTLLPLLR
jgi:hypothetical protein